MAECALEGCENPVNPMLPHTISGQPEKYCSRTCVDIAFDAKEKGKKATKVQTQAKDFGNAGVTRLRCDLKTCRKPITIKWADRVTGKEYCSNKCLKEAKAADMEVADATDAVEDAEDMIEETVTTEEADEREDAVDDPGPGDDEAEVEAEPVPAPAPAPAKVKRKPTKPAVTKMATPAPAAAKKPVKQAKTATKTAKKAVAKTARPVKKAKAVKKAAKVTKKAAKPAKAKSTSPKPSGKGFDVFRTGSAKHAIAAAFKTGKYMTREALETLATKAGVGFGQVRFAMAQLVDRGGIDFETRESDGAVRAVLAS